MEILKPNELREKFNDPWIAPYEKVLTMVDGDNVELVEYHPCISGSHWLLHQYRNNSELIDSAYRDGNKHVYKCHVGKAPLDLKASFNAAGIDEIVVDGDEVKVTHAGLAGAGVGAGMCRGMGEGVKYVELIQVGGGSKAGKATVVTPKLEKVVIGVDDTDTKDAGATWTMAHNLGVELGEMGFEYSNNHTHLEKFKGQWYLFHHTMNLQKNAINLFTLNHINLFSFKNFTRLFEYSIDSFNKSLLKLIIFCLFS